MRMTMKGKALCAVSLLLVFYSCSSGGLRNLPVSEEPFVEEKMAGYFSRNPVLVSGKAKLEFSRYRFRGVFRLESDENGARIDFDHSSMFGAVKEEGSVFISTNGISVFDNKRGTFYDGEASENLVSDAAGVRVLPEDLLMALLLDLPGFADLDSLKTYSDGDAWRVTGLRGDRRIDIAGERKSGPVLLEICGADGSWCFSASYRYGSSPKTIVYPEKIVIRKNDGSVRINMDIEKVSAIER